MTPNLSAEHANWERNRFKSSSVVGAIHHQIGLVEQTMRGEALVPVGVDIGGTLTLSSRFRSSAEASGRRRRGCL